MVQWLENLTHKRVIIVSITRQGIWCVQQAINKSTPRSFGSYSVAKPTTLSLYKFLSLQSFRLQPAGLRRRSVSCPGGKPIGHETEKHDLRDDGKENDIFRTFLKSCCLFLSFFFHHSTSLSFSHLFFYVFHALVQGNGRGTALINHIEPRTYSF